MALGPEYTEVEKVLIDQLTGMGWAHLEGAPPGSPPADPALSGRTGFDEVFLESRLRDRLRRINRGQDGRPWLDDRRIDQAVGALTRIPASSLLGANQRATELLLKGITVDGLPGWDGGRDQAIHYIDWANWDSPAANDFTAVSQFRVDIPGGQGRRIVPDLVLFVNGIPLAVIECKQPDTPLAGAVEQLRRYCEQRGAGVREGNAALFHPVQLLIATSGDRALLGSITSGPEHYASWRDPYPSTRDELAGRLGRAGEDSVTPQDILASAVLQPGRLLDITHNFVAFMRTDAGQTVKVVPRYQQYRAVGKAVSRLVSEPAKSQSGDGEDHRGGVVWHTQGSGKSLTMSFLVRKVRTVPGLRKTKVVIVTDRDDLQKQLGDTMALTGEPVTTMRSITQARRDLAQSGPGIICLTIQKQQDLDARKDTAGDRARIRAVLKGRAPGVPELNRDESILLLVDEAHRSHASELHANLTTALPNAARIGFTGTPIVMGAKKRTTKIFGPYIDQYLLKDAEADGAVVPIIYSGNRVKGAVRDGGDMDEFFEDLLTELTPDEIERVKQKYVTRKQVMEAPEIIAAKAKNMLRHYAETVLPNGYKAQVAAESRLAAVRYRDAFLAARDHAVARNPWKLAPEMIGKIRELDFVPVVSPGRDDPKAWETWTKNAGPAIASFKDPAKQPAFLIVNSMLLTGFDAPVEQVLYLDRSMREAELLQAIARVNRPATGTSGAAKNCGYVVDYAGVADHLARALAAYEATDVEVESHRTPADQVSALHSKLSQLNYIFTSAGITPDRSPEAMEACVRHLAPDPVRIHFELALKVFLSALDAVLPMAEATGCLAAARLYGEIAVRARRRYRKDGDFDPSLYGAKVRELIDEHLTSLEIIEILPPVSISDPEYLAKAARLSARDRASDMEHAIRHYITLHMGEDPVRYQRLSERLEAILALDEADWEQKALYLHELLDEVLDTGTGTDDDSPVTDRLEAALYRLMVRETLGGVDVSNDTAQRLADFCRTCHELAVRRTSRPDFWHHPASMEDFKKAIQRELMRGDLCPSPVVKALADQLFDIIRANDENAGSRD